MNLLLYAATPPLLFYSLSVVLFVGTSTSNITLSTCGTALYCNLLRLVCFIYLFKKNCLKRKKNTCNATTVMWGVSIEGLELKCHSSF